jgi:hypothetical protein
LERWPRAPRATGAARALIEQIAASDPDPTIRSAAAKMHGT